MEGFNPFMHPVNGPQMKPSLPAEGTFYEEFWSEQRMSLTDDITDLLKVDNGGVSLAVVRDGVAGRGGQVLLTPDGDIGDNVVVGFNDTPCEPQRNDRVYAMYFRGSIEDVSESEFACGFSGVVVGSADPLDAGTADGAWVECSTDGVFDFKVGDGTTESTGTGTLAAVTDDLELEITVLMWRNKRVEFWVNGTEIGRVLSPPLPDIATPFFQIENRAAAIDNGLFVNTLLYTGWDVDPS